MSHKVVWWRFLLFQLVNVWKLWHSPSFPTDLLKPKGINGHQRLHRCFTAHFYFSCVQPAVSAKGNHGSVAVLRCSSILSSRRFSWPGNRAERSVVSQGSCSKWYRRTFWISWSGGRASAASLYGLTGQGSSRGGISGGDKLLFSLNVTWKKNIRCY